MKIKGTRCKTKFKSHARSRIIVPLMFCRGSRKKTSAVGGNCVQLNQKLEKLAKYSWGRAS